MAEATAKSMLGQISQGHLECPICCCRFTEPKILDCLHSFCLNCLEELISRQQPTADRITCPVCRRETAVPDAGLQALANCFFLSSLVDEVKKQEQLLDKTSVDPSTCEECDEGLEAISRCLDCNKNICTKCQEAHYRIQFIRNHRIIKPGEQNTQISSTDHIGEKNVPHCRKHTNYEVCYYCESCQTLACAKCAAQEHRTAEHNYCDASQAIRSYRQYVDDALQKYEKSREKFKVAEESINHAKNRLEIMVTRACEDISAKEEEEIVKIKNKSHLLRDEVTKIGEERLTKFDDVLSSNREKMDRAEQIVATVNDLMQQADDFELLDLKPKVMHNLEFQEGLAFERADHGLSFIGVKCHDVVKGTNLGEVLHEEKWQLKEAFGKKGSGDGEFDFAQNVACFSNGDIIFTDINKCQLMVFTSTGVYKATVGQREGEGKLESPWGVAVTCNDLLLVCDEKTVKVFDSNLKYIRQFTPSQDDIDESESFLGDVAVNDKNRIAVADEGRKLVSLHNLDGSLISTIPNDMVENYVAISNKEYIIFTKYDEKKLICTNVSGNEVCNVDPVFDGKFATPVGVCCDEAGDIYVSVHRSERGSCEVHHYDPVGVHIGRVAHGLYNPAGLAFTPCGDLAVADTESIKIFQRV